MRYITIDHLRPGHKLAHNLVVSNRTLLLRRGKELTPALIEKIGSQGYQGLYIDDELSEGLEITDVISSDLRRKTKNELQLLFLNVSTNTNGNNKKHFDKLKDLSKKIVEEVLRNRTTMVNLVDLRAYDDYTYSHSLNVAVLSIIIGVALKLSNAMIQELAIGALIHDIGKMRVDKHILNKPGKLNHDEFQHMKNHSQLGYEYLLNNADISINSKIATLYHHERLDGTGYPEGLRGDSIPLFSRIISVADVYDALTSDRPYRKAMLPSDAIEYIMGGYGTKFDPEIVEIITKKVAPYPIGTCVQLSTGEVGIVVKNYEETSLRPAVKLIEDNRPTDKIIDLSNDRSCLNITVKEIINIFELGLRAPKRRLLAVFFRLFHPCIPFA
jgi:HD-GYP domain-containing protein (c-di-GMP phosphodiesterase class II)